MTRTWSALNFDASAPAYLAREVGLSHRAALRLRVMQDHDPWAQTEAVNLHPCRLPDGRNY